MLDWVFGWHRWVLVVAGVTWAEGDRSEHKLWDACQLVHAHHQPGCGAPGPVADRGAATCRGSRTPSVDFATPSCPRCPRYICQITFVRVLIAKKRHSTVPGLTECLSSAVCINVICNLYNL